MQNTNLDAIVVVIATLVIYWLICRLTKRKAWPRVRARFLARRPRPRRPVAFQAEVLPLASKGGLASRSAFLLPPSLRSPWHTRWAIAPWPLLPREQAGIPVGVSVASRIRPTPCRCPTLAPGVALTARAIAGSGSGQDPASPIRPRARCRCIAGSPQVAPATARQPGAVRRPDAALAHAPSWPATTRCTPLEGSRAWATSA